MQTRSVVIKCLSFLLPVLLTAMQAGCSGKGADDHNLESQIEKMCAHVPANTGHASDFGDDAGRQLEQDLLNGSSMHLRMQMSSPTLALEDKDKLAPKMISAVCYMSRSKPEARGKQIDGNHASIYLGYPDMGGTTWCQFGFVLEDDQWKLDSRGECTNEK